MSENPFQPAASYGAKPAGTSRGPKPTGVTVFAILCLILGIMGLIGVCLQGVGIAALGFAESVIADAPMPEDEKALQMKTIELTKEGMGIQIGITVLNFMVATLLIVGAFTGLAGKSVNLFKLATLVAGIYVILRAVITIVLVQMPMSAKLQDLPGFDSSQIMIQMGIAIGWAVIAAGLYLATHFYLRGSAVSRYYGT